MTSTDSPRRARPDGVMLISVWFIICSIIPLLGAVAILVFAFPAVIADTAGSDRYFAVGGVAFGFILVLGVGLLNVVAVVGLLRLREWARMLAIVLAALGLILVPFGTVAGALIIWYLLTDKAKQAFGAPLPEPTPEESIPSTQADHP